MKKINDVVDFFVEEVKDLPRIEKEVQILVGRLDEKVKFSGDWKKDYQNISDVEINAKKILEELTPLSEVPVGLGDSFISLRKACENAKQGLMEKKTIEEERIETIEINRRNFVSRVKGFMKDIKPREREALHRILTVFEENKELKKKIQKLRAENKKLKRRLDKS